MSALSLHRESTDSLILHLEIYLFILSMIAHTYFMQHTKLLMIHNIYCKTHNFKSVNFFKNISNFIYCKVKFVLNMYYKDIYKGH